MLRDLLKYLLITLLGTLPVSCVFDDGTMCIEESSAPHNIQFTVSMTQHGTTRATWGDEYIKDPGTAFENRILPEALRVAVYTTDNTLLGEIEDLYYWPTNFEQTEYKFTGAMPDAFTTHFTELIAASGTPEYKIMVLANCPEGDVEDLTYSYTNLDPETGAIPMWGIKKVNLQALATNQQTEIGVIELLRSAAKLEVKLSDELANNGAVIHGVYVNYYNQTGYCLPTGWETAENTEALDLTGCFRLYRHAAVKRTFTKNTDINYSTYVPEYDNFNYIGEKAKISVDLTYGGKRRLIEDAISFCAYDGGAPVENSDYNIIRNHIYQYRITKISGGNLMLEYTVADWDSEEWEEGQFTEEHDISYPTYHNPVVPKEFISLSVENQSEYVISDNPDMYYNPNNMEEGAFECYFKITAPAGVGWKPGFMASKEGYRTRVYKPVTDSNGTKTMELVFDSGSEDTKLHGNIGACAENEWYKIMVFPTKSEGIGTKVEFGISYYQMWTEQYLNLYINGEYDNIKWPNSGNNPKIINIEHVAQPQNIE